jgi:WD40 repeat protein
VRLESVCSIPIEEFLASRLAFTPDGQHIVIGHRGLTQYGILSGRVVRTYPFEAFVAAIEFSPDGRYVACVNEDDRQPKTRGMARIFDMETGESVWQADAERPIEAGCFLENGQGLTFLYKQAPADRGSRLTGVRLPGGDGAPNLTLPDWNLREMTADGASVTLFGQDSAPTTCDIEGASLDFYPFKVGAFTYPEGAQGRVRKVAVGAGRSKLAPGGQLLALELIDFSSRTHRLSLISVETGIEGRLALAADSVPAFAFSERGEHFLCLTEDPENGGGLLRLWETRTMNLLGRTEFPSHYHTVALHWPTRRLAAIGGGRCDVGLIHL